MRWQEEEPGTVTVPGTPETSDGRFVLKRDKRGRWRAYFRNVRESYSTAFDHGGTPSTTATGRCASSRRGGRCPRSTTARPPPRRCAGRSRRTTSCFRGGVKMTCQHEWFSGWEDAVTAPEDADASEGYVTRCQRCGVRARCLDRLTGEGYQRHRYASPQDGVCLRCERGRPYRGMAR